MIWSKAGSTSWATSATWASIKQGDAYTATITEGFSLTDHRSAGYALGRAEAIGIAESWRDHIAWVQLIEELIGIREKKTNTLEHRHRDGISIADSSRRASCLGAMEQIAVEEDTSKELTIIRQLLEAISITEKQGRSYGKHTAESLSLDGDMLHKARAIIADLAFSLAPLDADVPAGYSAFKKFMPGDYLYERALIKTVLSGELGGKTALLKGLTINVDLPDITDRGTKKVEAGEADISFSKDFFEVPEVSISMRSSSAGVVIPTITGVTRTGFTVKLLDASGSAASGTISWTALGC